MSWERVREFLHNDKDSVVVRTLGALLSFGNGTNTQPSLVRSYAAITQYEKYCIQLGYLRSHAAERVTLKSQDATSPHCGATARFRDVTELPVSGGCWRRGIRDMTRFQLPSRPMAVAGGWRERRNWGQVQPCNNESLNMQVWDLVTCVLLLVRASEGRCP
ncbi:uncharacterized protein BDZ99DRAFT_33117 [Mytilinidion resinicola]|uniref:Uncharacterized protein n=1 Tax=Mytilinidion resinicola TaxID=574789 RepID=A0A6A6YLE7_9PEZI|nr:uncharacterized protein BDZ99DRAFT_33117 [Mytilinidion resinicola]KAF2809630.1 hypothetical protein BDZ99DRAFT_33117 [Mytilinidion resinicola]